VLKVLDAPLVEIIDGMGAARHAQPGCSGIADFASITLATHSETSHDPRSIAHVERLDHQAVDPLLRDAGGPAVAD
jgi:hypothetical protein